MVYVYGTLVSPDDAGWIVARLYADAHADAVAAAHVIETGMERGLFAVALTPAHRDAVLRHLEGCPDGLAELHVTLLRDNRNRIAPRRHGDNQETRIAATSGTLTAR